MKEAHIGREMKYNYQELGFILSATHKKGGGGKQLERCHLTLAKNRKMLPLMHLIQFPSEMMTRLI